MEMAGCWYENCRLFCLISTSSYARQAVGFEMLFQESKGRIDPSSNRSDALQSSVSSQVCGCHQNSNAIVGPGPKGCTSKKPAVHKIYPKSYVCRLFSGRSRRVAALEHARGQGGCNIFGYSTRRVSVLLGVFLGFKLTQFKAMLLVPPLLLSSLRRFRKLQTSPSRMFTKTAISG